jgi:hypothetical protein
LSAEHPRPNRHRKKKGSRRRPFWSTSRSACWLHVACDNHRIAGNRRPESPPEGVPVFLTQVTVSTNYREKKVAPEGATEFAM